MKFNLFTTLFLLSVANVCLAQTVNVTYLNPQNTSSQYNFMRLGSSSDYFGGIMHNISSAAYGDGDDVSIFTYGDRDLTFGTGTGNVIIFPSSGGDVGIGTTTPTAKLDVNGIFRAQDKILVNKAGSYRIALNGENDSYVIGRNAASETKFDIRTNGNTYFNGGNVGIGIITPTALFEVNDNINNDWLSKMYNGGGAGLGLLVQSGYGGSHSNNDGIILQLEDGNGNSRMKVQSNGKVGIGTVSPTALLEVNDNINGNWLSKMYNGGGDGLGLLVQSGYGGAQSNNTGTILQLEDGNGNLRMKVQSNGKVGIGTNDIPDGYQLAIAGPVIAEEIDVQLEGQWPDFVFEKEYKLPTLKEVERHILRKGHLQNIPSQEEIKEEGINLGEMDAKLLQKIEELMLYTIQQQKEIEDLKKEIQDLKG